MENLITVSEFCTCYDIDDTFLSSLHEAGLIEVVILEEQRFIHHDQLPQLEKFVHFHYELDINVPGIEAIDNLLKKVESMQAELAVLRRQLKMSSLMHER
jgi:chaperone modulatory protein CbpM